MNTTSTISLACLLIATAANAQVGSFVNSGAGCPTTGTTAATDINAADDTVNGPHLLGWTFNYPGGAGSTTSIDIAPNGYIYLESGTNTDTRCCNGAIAGVPDADFLAATPSIACFGQDMNSSTTSATGAGSVHFETNGVDEATITWDHVAEFGQLGSMNTFVCTLRGDGSITIEWNNCAILLATREALIGYSPGGLAIDGGSMDFSAPVVGVAGEAVYETFLAGTFDLSNSSVILIPAAGSYQVVPGATPPARDPMTISSALVPTIGQTFVIDTNDTPSGSLLNIVFFGDTAVGGVALPGAPGCSIYMNANIGTLDGTSVSLPIPATISLIGVVVEAQGAAFVPGINPLNLVTTGLGTLTVGDVPLGLTFNADGTNSFNSVTTAGFFSLENNTTLDITALTVDFSVNLPGKEFDTDQTGMADRFDGGNSAVAGCLGTYRNGSAAATGLVFAGTPAAPCDATANSGWIGSNPLGTVNDFETIDFTFTDFNPGETFEFDVDTDGVGGTNGGAMAGTVITVTLSDGTITSGSLALVSATLSSLAL